MRLLLLLLLLLPLTSSTLIALSTLPTFRCHQTTDPHCATSHPLPLSQLPLLLRSLTTRTANHDLHILPAATSPHLILLVTSPAMPDPPALQRSLAAAMGAVSAFIADTEGSFMPVEGPVVPLDRASFDGPVTQLAILHSRDEARVLQIVKALTEKTAGKLAVLWTTRDDAEANADPKVENMDADADAGQADDGSKGKRGIPLAHVPLVLAEITVPQFTGLLVVLLFLMIFIPGFLCLWNIQTPQTFQQFDQADAAKKMQ